LLRVESLTSQRSAENAAQRDAITGIGAENIYLGGDSSLSRPLCIGLHRIGVDLRLKDMAAFGASQRPVLEAGTRRDNALDCQPGLASGTAALRGAGRQGGRRRLQIGHGVDPGKVTIWFKNIRLSIVVLQSRSSDFTLARAGNRRSMSTRASRSPGAEPQTEARHDDRGDLPARERKRGRLICLSAGNRTWGPPENS
jgi:hypothetical protein